MRFGRPNAPAFSRRWPGSGGPPYTREAASRQGSFRIMPQDSARAERPPISQPTTDNNSTDVLDELGAELRVGTAGVAPETAAALPRTEPSLALDAVRSDGEVQAYIRQANKNLGVLGFTEHGFRHVGLVANIARNVLRLLEYDHRQQELAAIAGYLHDIGNVVSRHSHATTGAVLA
jgi:hypothetical protein